MGFLSEFEAFFTPEEKESEMFRILSMIGVNTEKAILEEMNAEIRRSTELMAFPDQRLRSWLAFFLRKVRNVVSARGYAKITVKGSYDGKLISIENGANIIGKNGKNYKLIAGGGLSLAPGETKSFRFIQGELKQASGSYDEIIAIPALNVDLGDLIVKLEGVEIPHVPEVSPAMDVASNLLSKLKQKVESESPPASDEDSSTDEVSKLLSKLSQTTESGVYWMMENVFSSLRRVYVRPMNGYFAFYHSNTLYIKIYRGADVPDPTGKRWSVGYWVSDGIAGNMGENQLEQFVSVPDLDGLDYVLENDPVVTGSAPPTRAELVNLLREKFTVTTNVASVPEYMAWFKARPEVGDCLVVSDYERWMYTGKFTSQGSFGLSGAVDVFLMGNNGESLVEKDLSVSDLTKGYGWEDDSNNTLKVIDNDLRAVRDIAVINYKTYETYHHYFVVQFSSTLNDVAFKAEASSAISSFYDLKKVKAMGSSLFQPLDLQLVNSVVGNLYSPVGLRIYPFHYFEIDVGDVVNDVLRAYSGGVAGGWYELMESEDSNRAGEYKMLAVFREFPLQDGSCRLYEFEGGICAGVNWPYGTPPTGPVGIRYPDGGIVFNEGVLSRFSGCKLRCFWKIKTSGMVPVGSYTDDGFGARSINLGSVFGDKGVRFEKYL